MYVQLPGMSTEPVRVTLEVTWWPHDNTWGIARRDWRRDGDNGWQLEGMATNGTPLTANELINRLQLACQALEEEVIDAEDPFSAVGAFR